MKKCLIYGTAQFYKQLEDFTNIIACYEEMGQFEVLGFVSTDPEPVQWGKYRPLSHDDLLIGNYDIIIVMVPKKFFVVCKSALIRMGISPEIIIPCVAMTFAHFDIDKYLTILHNPPSIFVNSCWGGLTYNSLCLQFASPMINMFESREDFLKLMNNLPYYLSLPVKLERYEWETNQKKMYPVGRIDDVLLHFNHYDSFEEAESKWKDRKMRINKENILVVSNAHDQAYAELFSQLPYEKKICFAPFEADIPNLAYVDVPDSLSQLAFYQVVNRMGMGDFEYYDVFELLTNGLFIRL
jgi:uncharacterized protein (DUF1919 family)